MNKNPSFQITCEGIGTHWWIDIFDNLDKGNVLATTNLVKNEISDFEKKYSRFKKDSLISQFSRGEFIPKEGSELFEMLHFAEKVKTITNGYFDISVGQILRNLGYGSSDSIDLGGLGKGWLIDKLANILKENRFNNFTINGGGDIYSCGDKRLFYLENPLDSTEYIGSITIQNSSIAASSGNKRKWENNQQKSNHHLINPKNGKSVVNVAGVFTQANTALYSDVAATCFFVSPSELIPAIADYFESEYLIVFSDGLYKRSAGYTAELF